MLETHMYAGEIIDSNECEYVRWHFESNIFSEIEELKNLASDISLKKIADDYLNTSAICTNKQAWISKGISNQNISESSGAAQLYHFDYDSFNFVKVMIYLSDVCSGSGPHTYMRKTHKPFKDEKTWRQIKPYGRYTDEQVYSLFGRENEIKICGGAGTVILVDTSGFHKGRF